MTAAVESLEIAPGAVAADLGFGGGLGLRLLLDRVGPRGQVHGAEISTVMLSSAASRHPAEVNAGRLHLHEGSMTQLPLADAVLDAAITANTIYFIAELDRAFAEVARVLKDTGRVTVGMADPSAMARLPFTAYGFRLRPAAEVEGALRDAGLAVEDHRRVGDCDHAYHLFVATPIRSPASVEPKP